MMISRAKSDIDKYGNNYSRKSFKDVTPATNCISLEIQRISKPEIHIYQKRYKDQEAGPKEAKTDKNKCSSLFNNLELQSMF